MKKHKHNVLGGFKGNTPPMKVELEYKLLEDGTKVPVGSYRAEQVRGDGVYHATKGFRKIRQYRPHTLLSDLLTKIGLQPLYSF